MSKRLQELLLDYLNGKVTFKDDCDVLQKFSLILLALGKKSRIEVEEGENTCILTVECSHAS
ncbi:hypothetical protein GO597_02300 [Sulfolobus acidocaldarius DSM 639]|nr:hypothetical protein GO597_02300 [Sulfolobus acidocaldarius DSM 639]